MHVEIGVIATCKLRVTPFDLVGAHKRAERKSGGGREESDKTTTR
jgi:hypothetical protein